MLKLKRKKISKKEKKEIVILTARELSEKIEIIMKKHIGRKNPITQAEMFEKLFGNPYSYSDIQIWFLLDRIKRAMNWLRRTSKCFVISMRTKNNVYCYFVVRDYDDADVYIDYMDKVKKRISFMQERCLKAVKEEFWKEL